MQGKYEMIGARLKEKLVKFILLFILTPVTIWVGIFFFDDRKYFFISLLLILYSIAAFAISFEMRKPKAREMVLIAVLTAIAVAGRAAFFMIPQMKPVVAVVIIVGVCFGGETGFLVGAMTGLISSVFFGQGPFVPWQMFAFGIIGYLAGFFVKKGMLKIKTGQLAAFGGLSALLLYGFIMDVCSVLMWTGQPTWGLIVTAFAAGSAFNLMHAAATIIFLLLFSRPMIEKIMRIRIKYGMQADSLHCP
jgi:energy-coupling factor transport system substrate-specific component